MSDVRLMGVVSVIALAMALPSVAFGQAGVADEADALFMVGTAAYQEGRLDDALLYFLQSNRLSPNKSVSINIGHTYNALQRYPEAYRWYLEGKSLGADPDDVDRMLKQLEGSVALLRVESTPPGADIYLNRKNLGSVAKTPATLAVEPGEYTVIVELEAHTGFTSELIDLSAKGMSSTVKAELKVVTGRVSISGQDGATVHLAEETAAEVCRVPCTADLPIGRQLLYFKKEGFRSQPALVDVRTDRTTTVRTDMALVTGSVRVETADPGALIEIDGEPAGFTPNIVTGVRSGTRTVRVSRPGATPVEIVVEVPRDGQIDLGRVVLSQTTSVQSASRYREDIFEAPASISVIGREELDAFRYPNLVDSLRGVRGVETQSWWGSGVTGVIGIRGLVPIPAVDPGQRTRFLRDGLVMETQTNSYGMQSQRAQEVESIEVQRGAGSVLYGTGAISGIVSMYTRDRVTESAAEVEAGAIGREAQGRAFLGLGDEELGGWVSVNGHNLNGMALTLRGMPVVDAAGAPLLDVNGKPTTEDIDLYDTQPSVGLNVETKVWAKDLELRYAHFSQSHTLNYGVRITPRELWDSNTNETQRHLLDLVYKPKLSDAVSLDTRVYGQSHRDNLYLVSSIYSVDRTNEDQWGGIEARAFIDPVKAWRENSQEKRRFRLSLGTEYHSYPRATNTQIFDIPVADERQVDEGTEDGMSVLAVYALADVRPVKFFALSVGGRVDSWDQAKEDFVQFNPRIVGMVFPSDRDVVKVIAGRGFRVGDISERLTRTPTLIALPGPIDPEAAWTGELEVRHRFGNDWTALASVWQASIEGLIEQLPNQDPDSPNFGLLQSQNAFNAQIRGFDLEAQRVFRGGWMFTAWYSRQDPTSAASAAANAESVQLPGSPKEQAATKLVVPLTGGAKVATRIVYEGRRRLSGADGFTDDAVIADVIVSGRVAGETGNWFAGVYNVTGREWATPASTSTFATVEAPEMRQPLFRGGLELKGRLSKKTLATSEPMPDAPQPVDPVEVLAPEGIEAEEPISSETPS